MSPDTPQDDHLAELRRRWEADPGSRLYLQLAEEYRRAGRHDEALQVLQKGLERYPHQVSALVSLGRIHLESGRAAEAATVLEKAVSMDATNMVAMKLAFEAYLQQGDRDQARQSLELYKLLNAGDPEVEELERRLEGRPAETAPEHVVTETPAEAEAEGAVETAAADAPQVPRIWSPTAAWPALPRDEETVEGAATSPVPPPPPPAGAPPPPSAPAATQAVRHGEEDPFTELGSAELHRRYLSALGAEGIFPLAAEEATEPQPEREAVAADAGEAAPPPVESTSESGLGLEPAGDDEEAETWGAETREDESTEAPADERPTVTLGQLYLDQGHFADAERIFEAVLARDADSVAARTGLLRARAAVAAGPGENEPAASRRSDEAAAWGAASQGGATVDAETGAETAVAAPETPPPRGFELTAQQLLAGVESGDPHRALLLAYLDRLRGHGTGRKERGLDVS